MLPVGLLALVSDALSLRVSPMAPLDGLGVVPRDGLFLPIVTGSAEQPELAALLLASPA